MVDSCHLFNHIVPGWFTGTVIVSEIIQSMDKIDLGPVSLTVSPSQFKFDGNSISLSPRFLYSDCYKILYMARQLCCRGMCKILLRSDGQQRNYGKAKFPSNLNCGQKNVSETGPCIKWWQCVWAVYIILGMNNALHIWHMIYAKFCLDLFSVHSHGALVKWHRLICVKPIGNKAQHRLKSTVWGLTILCI